MSTVHDVRAARGDRPLYQRLYATTTPYVEQLLRDKTAINAAALLTTELAGLRDFVAADAPLRAQATGPIPERPGVRGEFARHLEAELARSASPDASATRELAEEFSHALWGMLLRHMRLGAGDDGCCRAVDLYPPAGEPGATQRGELEEALEPFGITPYEANLVLRDVLKELGAGAPVAEPVRFPLGLWIGRDTLSAALSGGVVAPGDRAQNRGLFQSLLDFVRPSA